MNFKPHSRRSVTYSRRCYLARRDGLCCHYCKKVISIENSTIDHRTPLMRGGKDDPSNLVLACGTCNSQKGPMTEQEFKAYGPLGGRFLVLLDAGLRMPIPSDALWPKGRYKLAPSPRTDPTT